mgnify:CR=1 FL=1
MSYLLFLSIGIVLLFLSIVLKLLRQECGIHLETGWGRPYIQGYRPSSNRYLAPEGPEGTYIERIYAERQDSDGRMRHQRVASAKEVELMSLSQHWTLLGSVSALRLPARTSRLRLLTVLTSIAELLELTMRCW